MEESTIGFPHAATGGCDYHAADVVVGFSNRQNACQFIFVEGRSRNGITFLKGDFLKETPRDAVDVGGGGEDTRTIS